jgi:hypothetical protein
MIFNSFAIPRIKQKDQQEVEFLLKLLKWNS